MAAYKDNSLTEWDPFSQVGAILQEIGISEGLIGQYRESFDEFRYQEPDKPLSSLPEGVLSSDEWSRLLGFEYDLGSTAFLKQINLDNIGRDFLCLIYYRQRYIEIYNNGGDLYEVLKEFLGQDGLITLSRGRWYSSLKNSLILIEALTDSMMIEGVEFRPDPSEFSFILTDPPTTRMAAEEMISPFNLLRDTTNLSRYVRRISVTLQDNRDCDNLISFSFGYERFNLQMMMKLFRDRRNAISTDSFAEHIALSREFCLWSPERYMILPSINTIAQEKNISYLSLIEAIIDTEQNSGIEEGFEGLYLLKEGLSDRIIRLIESKI